MRRNLNNGATDKIGRATGERPDFMIIGPNTQNRLVDKAPAETVFFMSHDIKTNELVRVQSQGPVPRAFPDNISIYTDKGLTYGDKNAPATKLIENLTYSTEYAVAGVEQVLNQLDPCNNECFLTKKLNIGLSDMHRNGGGFVSMNYVELLKQTFLWGNVDVPGKHGKLGWMEEEMFGDYGGDGRDIYDQHLASQRQHRFSEQPTLAHFNEFSRKHYSEVVKDVENFLKYKDEHIGTEKYVNTIGQISRTYFSDETLKDYSNLLRTVFYKSDEDVTKAERGLSAYFQLMRSIESQRPSKDVMDGYAKILIQQNIGRSYNTGRIFVAPAVNGVKSFRTNEFGSWDLPIKQPADPYDNIRYPIGFNNPAGILTIDAQGETAGWIDAAKLAKLAAAFLRDLYKKASDHVESCTAVKKELCPPQYQEGLKGAYTLATLITKQRPSLWVPVVKPHTDTQTPGNAARLSGQSKTSTDPGIDKSISHITSSYAQENSDGFMDKDARTFISQNRGVYDPQFGPFIVLFPTKEKGKFEKFAIPYVPLVIASQSEGFNVGKNGTALARMGGNTVQDLLEITYRYSKTSKSMTVLLNVLDLLGKKSNDENSFLQLRGFVNGLVNISDKDETDNQKIVNAIEVQVAKVAKLLTKNTQPERQNASSIVHSYYTSYTKKKEESKRVPRPKPKEYSSHRERWLDIEYRVESAAAGLHNTVHFADKLPTVWPNLGPEIFSSFYGCNMVYGGSTAWSEPILEDWSQKSVDKLQLDLDGFYFRKPLNADEPVEYFDKGKESWEQTRLLSHAELFIK